MEGVAEEGKASRGKIASGLSRFLHRSLAVGWSQWAWYANANNGLNALLYKMLVRVVVALFQRWVELQRLKQQARRGVRMWADGKRARSFCCWQEATADRLSALESLRRGFGHLTHQKSHAALRTWVTLRAAADAQGATSRVCDGPRRGNARRRGSAGRLLTGSVQGAPAPQPIHPSTARALDRGYSGRAAKSRTIC